MNIIKQNIKHQKEFFNGTALEKKFFKYLRTQKWNCIKDTKHKFEFESDKGHHIVFDLDEKQDDYGWLMTAKISKDNCKTFYIVKIRSHWEFDEFLDWSGIKLR